MDIFRGRLQAQEGAYHKKEQEYVLKEYRRQLQKDGKLVVTNLAQLPPGQRSQWVESERYHNVLPEILQQGARVSEPEWVEITRAHGLMPPIVGDKKAPKLFWGSNAMGSVPASRLGRNRFNMPNVPETPPLTAKETAALRARRVAAEKAFFASARALGYGLGLGLAGTVVGVRCVMWYCDVHSVEDLRNTTTKLATPLKGSVHAVMSPFAKWAKENYALEDNPTEAGGGLGEIRDRLQSKMNPSKGGKAPIPRL